MRTEYWKQKYGFMFTENQHRIIDSLLEQRTKEVIDIALTLKRLSIKKVLYEDMSKELKKDKECILEKLLSKNTSSVSPTMKKEPSVLPTPLG